MTPARIAPRDWRAFLLFWCWIVVAIGGGVGFITGDELRATRDAGLPHAWLSICFAACIAMIVVGCIGAIVLERGRR